MTNYVGEYRGKAQAIYHFEGNANDSSGNNNNGNPSNVAFGLSYGRFGQGASFNGSSSCIGTAYGTFGFLKNTPHTFIAFAKTLSTKENTIECAYSYFDASNSGGHYFKINSNNKLYLYVKKNAGSAYSVTGNIIIPNNKFTMVSFRHNGSKISIFVDGIFDNEANCPIYGDWNGTWDGGIRLGRRQTQSGGTPSFTDYFNGYIDEAFYLDKALSNEEIRKYYAWAIGKLL